jgi:hypothetical protein
MGAVVADQTVMLCYIIKYADCNAAGSASVDYTGAVAADQTVTVFLQFCFKSFVLFVVCTPCSCDCSCPPLRNVFSPLDPD